MEPRLLLPIFHLLVQPLNPTDEIERTIEAMRLFQVREDKLHTLLEVLRARIHKEEVSTVPGTLLERLQTVT